MYSKLNSIIGDNYSKIVALPFGAPYNRDSDKFPYIIDSKYPYTSKKVKLDDQVLIVRIEERHERY